MSETTTMPFQPGTLAAAPEGPEFDEPTGNKRVLIILAFLGALAVLLIAGYFLLFAGGSDDKVADAGVPAPVASTAPTTAPSTAPKPAAQPKISARNFGTDPFKALISTDVVAAAPAVPTTTVPATTVPTTTIPATADPTTTGTTTTPAASQSYRFKVVKVSSDNSTISVTVNGKAHNDMKAGEVFAKIFKVRFIGGNVNAFQIGDEVFNVSGTKAVNISS